MSDVSLMFHNIFFWHYLCEQHERQWASICGNNHKHVSTKSKKKSIKIFKGSRVIKIGSDSNGVWWSGHWFSQWGDTTMTVTTVMMVKNKFCTKNACEVTEKCMQSAGKMHVVMLRTYLVPNQKIIVWQADHQWWHEQWWCEGHDGFSEGKPSLLLTFSMVLALLAQF